MKLIKILLIFAYISISLYTQICSAKTVRKYYGSVQEELIGTIYKLTFPGPPNYEDIKNGDRSETCPYLVIDYPIDVFTKQSVPIDFQHVQLIQLAIGEKSHWKLLKDGMRVKVKGELYEAHTGHHHTRVLMLVDDAQLEKSKPMFSIDKSRIICGSDNGFCEIHL